VLPTESRTSAGSDRGARAQQPAPGCSLPSSLQPCTASPTYSTISPSPGPPLLPLDAEEFVAAQLLLDGALQKEGPAVAGGVAVVGEQDHQQEHHVDEEILAGREQKGFAPQHRGAGSQPCSKSALPTDCCLPRSSIRTQSMLLFLLPYGKQLKMQPRPQAHNNIFCSKQPAQHHMFQLICTTQAPTRWQLGSYASYGGLHPLKGNYSVTNTLTLLQQP